MKFNNIAVSATLHNGVKIPYLGLGTYLLEDGHEVIETINTALEVGYRHIDTASFYRNEKGVGQAVRESSIPREEIFVTTKVWNADQGYENTLAAFDKSMNLLGLEYLDLYLVHWPVEGKYKATWKALEYLYKTGKVKAIGVSNFMKNHLEDLLPTVEIVPMVNQMEFHPYLVQQDLLDYCKAKQIQYQAWSPIMQGEVMNVKLLQQLAAKYNKTVVQVVLRWDLQKGVVTIPKTAKKERIIGNAQIFDFELSEADMKKIDALDKTYRFGPDPNNFNF